MNIKLHYVFLPLCLLVALTSQTNAQLNLNDRNHGSVGAKLIHKRMRLCFGFNAGIGIPKNDFAKADSNGGPLASSTIDRGTKNDTAKYNGYAKPGFHFNLYGQYMVSRVLGLKVMVAGTINSYNISAFNTESAEIWQKEYGANSVPPIYAAKGGYYIGQYMLGPCFRLRLSSRTKLEGHLLAGLIMANYPVLTANNTVSGNMRVDTGIYSFVQTGSYSLTIVSASGLGFNAAAGIEWLLTPFIGLHFNLNYMGSNLHYPNYNIAYDYLLTESGKNSTLYQNSTYSVSKSMNMGLLQFTLGGSVDL